MINATTAPPTSQFHPNFVEESLGRSLLSPDPRNTLPLQGRRTRQDYDRGIYLNN
jgi:hypothetical protein